MNKYSHIRRFMRSEFAYPTGLLTPFRQSFCLFEGEGGGGGPTVESLQAELSKISAKNTELIGELRTARSTNDKFKDIDPDKARAALAAAEKAEADRALAAGEFDKLKTQMAGAHKVELDKLTGSLDKTTSFLHRQLRRSALSTALLGKDGQPIGNITLLDPHMSRYIKVVENPNAVSEDDHYTTVVIDGAGNPRVKDGAGAPFTVADLVAEYSKKPEFQQAFFAPNTSGGGSGGAGAGDQAGAGVIVVTAEESKDPVIYRRKKAQAEKEGKRLEVRSGFIPSGM